MTLTKKEIKAAYDSGARRYDLWLHLYDFIGFNIKAYRLRCIELLRLSEGDFVIELGCGTGLNFPFILEQIGPMGRLVGVDISPNMLANARKRIDRGGWRNVELVESDISKYKFPDGYNAVISTGVFGFLADYDGIIKDISRTLSPGGRVVIFDGKKPASWPLWLLKLFILFGKPYGLTMEYFAVRPWESVERYFKDTTYEEKYGGSIYFSTGIKLTP